MLRLFAIVAILSTLSGHPAQSATRVYLMRGLGELSPFGKLEAALRARGAIVTNWSWTNWRSVVADALQHPQDRVIIAGHSMGDLKAFQASEALYAAGRVSITIGLDPLCTWPRATKGLVQYNILGNVCLPGDGKYHTVRGATNVFIRGTGHIRYPTDPRVIKRVVQYAFPK